MTERTEQIRRIDDEGVATTKTTRVSNDDMATTEPVAAEQGNLATRIIWYVTGVLLTLLAFRFVLVLLGANPANGFADFIYTISHPFAAPFFGLFGYSLHYGVSRVELSTLVAIAVYALIAFGLSRLFTIRAKRPVVA